MKFNYTTIRNKKNDKVTNIIGTFNQIQTT